MKIEDERGRELTSTSLRIFPAPTVSSVDGNLLATSKTYVEGRMTTAPCDSFDGTFEMT